MRWGDDEGVDLVPKGVVDILQCASFIYFIVFLHHIHPPTTYETWTYEIRFSGRICKSTIVVDFEGLQWHNTICFDTWHVVQVSYVYNVQVQLLIMQFSMIFIFRVVEKAMLDIFETWNASNPELSKVLKWSLSINPCTNWSGVTCSQWNQSIHDYTMTDEVNQLRYISYLVPYAYFITKNKCGTFNVSWYSQVCGTRRKEDAKSNECLYDFRKYIGLR